MSNLLTASQRAAVEHVEGPLLVLAGPGSGKTRVITHRISRLVEGGVAAEQILALTFTNKAAREMSQRVEQLVGGGRVRVSTFHRFCSRLLRQFADRCGLRQNFTILDQSDQVSLIRQIMKDVGLDTSVAEPGRVLARISRSRNELMTSEQFRERFEQRASGPIDAAVYQVFAEYEQRVRAQNSVDFDDLLLHVVHLLQDEEELRAALDEQFRYVMVDEYQDTNLAQYRIVRALARDQRNLCVTGDPDQSIYGWRGARPANISAFEKDYPEREVVTLDQNFRSTGRIVSCADRLISFNARPHRGRLTTENEEGEAVRLRVFASAEAEADGIAQEIAEGAAAGHLRPGDVAVFYRVNSLSRLLETALARHEIPYQIAAGYSFFERAEVRDLIAYLRLIENSSDNAAFERVVNRPARGIGATTVRKLRRVSSAQGISLFEAAQDCERIAELSARARSALSGFVDLIERMHEVSADGEVAPLIETLMAEIDYLSLWRADDDEVDVDRQANVFELLSAARQYDASGEELFGSAEYGTAADQAARMPDDRERGSLQGFLEMATLSSEADSVDPEGGMVTLMTMHASKGLEFPCVYIMGVESGLIPHERAVRDGNPASFEEERRLLFVGITRAERRLTLTQASERSLRGMRRTTISSPFIPEIADQLERESRSALLPSAARVVEDRVLRARQRYEAAQGRDSGLKLMTAAQMLEQHAHDPARDATDDPADADVSFRPGMMVRHPRYGRGVVAAVSGGSHRATVTVQFETGDETQTFVASRCPLQPIGHRDTDF